MNLEPPILRAADLRPGDVIDRGGALAVVVDVTPGPRAEPGDPRTVWVALENAGPARPFLETDPVRLVTDPDGRPLWAGRREPDEVEVTLAEVHRTVGERVLDAWPHTAPLTPALARVYLGALTAEACAGRPVSPHTIGSLLDLHAETLRRHLRDLVDAGLLERVPAESPRRGFLYRRTSSVDVEPETR